MKTLCIIGAGPAGLMAAEAALSQGVAVDLYDAMPTPGRKFLLAGVGGLNLTHAEPRARFETRYFERTPEITRLLDGFDADALRAWAHGLGIETFIGSSMRVFPTGMKAAPLLRAWLKRLRAGGLNVHVRQRWLGFNSAGALRFATPQGERTVKPDAALLALGGASWARLGSDGAWVPWLRECGIAVHTFAPANCGFEVHWREPLKRFAGAPVKAVALRIGDLSRRGEFILTEYGIEGSLVYALSKAIRESLKHNPNTTFELDLKPDWDQATLEAKLLQPRNGASFANHLRRRVNLSGVQLALLNEALPAESRGDARAIAQTIKAARFALIRPRPLDEAISSAGGVAMEALDENQMLRDLPGVFCAGEMLDWEAPTGGYLLTACFASGWAAGLGAARWLKA